MPQALGVIAAVTSVASTVYSFAQQRKANRAQDRAAKARRRQEQLANRRERRQAIRRAQVARAQAIATSVGTGAFGGSGSQGGIGAVQSQLGSELGFSSQFGGLSGIITSQTQEARRRSGLADIGGQIANISGGIANKFGGFDTIFGLNKEQQVPNLHSRVG